MAVKKLNESDFHETIKNSELPALVDFYADWCAPCRQIAPLMKEISDETAGTALVYSVDVDACPGLASEFSIMSIPFVVSFKNGKLHKKSIGVVPKPKLLELLE